VLTDHQNRMMAFHEYVDLNLVKLKLYQNRDRFWMTNVGIISVISDVFIFKPEVFVGIMKVIFNFKVLQKMSHLS